MVLVIIAQSFDFGSIFNEIIMKILDVDTWYELFGLNCQKGKIYRYLWVVFSHALDPFEFGAWKLLRAPQYTDTQKVVCATFALQGPAERWWRGIEHLLRMELGENTLITWEKFKEVFNETYFPDVVRDQKEKEFSDLVQGTMTVEEYAVKFVKLSCFAPHLIPNELKKVKKVSGRS